MSYYCCDKIIIRLAMTNGPGDSGRMLDLEPDKPQKHKLSKHVKPNKSESGECTYM